MDFVNTLISFVFFPNAVRHHNSSWLLQTSAVVRTSSCCSSEAVVDDVTWLFLSITLHSVSTLSPPTVHSSDSSSPPAVGTEFSESCCEWPGSEGSGLFKYFTSALESLRPSSVAKLVKTAVLCDWPLSWHSSLAGISVWGLEDSCSSNCGEQFWFEASTHDDGVGASSWKSDAAGVTLSSGELSCSAGLFDLLSPLRTNQKNNIQEMQLLF